MATLSTQDRIDLCADMMRVLSAIWELCAINKIDLRAAVNAADDWVEANKASFNNALPAAAKTNLTASQKARLLEFVVRQRFVKGV